MKMAGDRVEIDPLGLASSVAQTTAAAGGMALQAGQGGLAAVTHLGGGVDALTAEIAAAIAGWSVQAETIAADLTAGGTHLGQATTATTTGLTDTDHTSGANIDTITT